jgi:hypothetical protein
MKYKRLLIPILITAMAISGCKKQEVESTALSSITITNAIIGGAQAKLGAHVAAPQNLNNNAAASFSLPAGNNRVYIWPVGDSLHPYYDKVLTSSQYETHSLFLTGTSANVESLLIKETLPVHNDSAFGVRFINLSPGSPAVKVTLSTSTTVSEFGNVAYKEISAFKVYSATAVNSTYTFQVRNAATDAIIATNAMTGISAATGIPRYSNITLVLRGVVSGSPAAGITRVNHYFKL